MKRIALLPVILVWIVFIFIQPGCERRSSMDKTAASPGRITNDNTWMEYVSGNTDSLMTQTFINGLMQQQLGKTAWIQALHPKVKSFAERMQKEHAAINTELSILAKHKRVLLPDSMPSEMRVHLDEMRKLPGSTFDIHYMDMMVKAHENAVDLFKANRYNKNREVQKFIDHTLAILENDYQKAKEIQKELK